LSRFKRASRRPRERPVRPGACDVQARRDSIRAAISLALCFSKLISDALSILGPCEVPAF
jgi:hypothetical protein